MNNQKDNFEHAIVLGGGGSLAIGWELGYLSALSEAGIDVRHADLVIGTSGGAQAGTSLTSDHSWEEIYDQQIAPKSNEEPPVNDMSEIFARYNEIEKDASTPEEWIKNYSIYALEDHKFNESVHINRLKNRIKVTEWPSNMMITAVNANKAQRVALTSESNVDIHRAMASSGSLPGVWPATTIDGEKHFDGGCHSMENADLAKGAKKVLIFATNLPVATPYTLDDAIKELEQNGSEVKLITPSKEVFNKLQELGGNTVNPAIRPDIFKVAQDQGRQDAKMIKTFWE
ncbi:putative esterase of the alpha-beta hydrolase superfamily [Staphylococcus petrasii]|uniref:Putative esterase of the alpha-beta hydrolase superfamily n=1 Tax=Staphylococcus petrasii TaxID=1276936 RepID=A0A380FXE3_9STAP|nr:patatin-like phospholipase family protein [Staphylococcus petrasii]PNZ32144.1 patatin [Staphylococcus petrasii]TGE12143.1 patatin-like phospholipase family protein [Staphylococcus petrasii]SUM42623.1 putative esterase of the alpha-beta hydrolase superfamily [Staphylococcus petrasii]